MRGCNAYLATKSGSPSIRANLCSSVVKKPATPPTFLSCDSCLSWFKPPPHQIRLHPWLPNAHLEPQQHRGSDGTSPSPEKRHLLPCLPCIPWFKPPPHQIRLHPWLPNAVLEPQSHRGSDGPRPPRKTPSPSVYSVYSVVQTTTTSNPSPSVVAQRPSRTTTTPRLRWNFALPRKTPSPSVSSVYSVVQATTTSNPSPSVVAQRRSRTTI